jgi:PAS domain S-box-containing protein
MLSRCNEALNRIESESKLLDAICQIAVDVGGMRMAWVGYALDDENKTVVPKAHAGIEAGYLSEIKLSWAEDQLVGRGPVGQAIRSGRPVIIPDVVKEASFRQWLDAAWTRGYRGVICLPLKNKDRTFGTLALYLSKVRQVPADEMKWMQELADNLAFGIMNIRTREERVRMQEAVLEKSSLLDSAQDAIYVQDLSHQITYWNKSAERIYGWSAEEVTGRRFDQIVQVDAEKFAEADQVVREKGEWSGEIQKVTRHGVALTLDCRWTLLRDDQGRPKSVMTIATDITERRKLEEQFLRAQRMECIGTLAGGMAHDLNNVFLPILLAIDMLKLSEKDPTNLNVLETVESSAKRGADMVRHVLSFARGVESRRQEVQIEELLPEIEKIANDTFPKNIITRLVVPTGLWMVSGDLTQLHQVLLNLCVNARDAMPNGGSLSLSAQNINLPERHPELGLDAKPGTYVVVQVEDNGTGIPKKIIDKIFDPFFTTKELGKGTGLGLSTSLTIIKSHGGFIQVQSEAGKGTRFRIYLPATVQSPTSTRLVTPSKLRQGAGELILVVDDEASVRTIAKKTLEAFGYRVVLACDGSEALTVYESRRTEIAAVLTDMMMPVMDGPTAIQGLRKMNPQLPVIAASGLYANDRVAALADLGVKQFLPKPYTAEILLKALWDALHGSETKADLQVAEKNGVK